MASALVHQAGIEYDLGLREAKGTLSRAFQLAAEHGWSHVSWWDPRLVASLCRRALQEGVLPELALQLARRRLAVGSAEAPARLPLERPAAHRPAGTVPILDARDGHREAFSELLLGCTNRPIEGYLQAAVAGEIISVEGLRTLRQEDLLTWREIEIFVDYSLREAMPAGATSTPLRVSCANRLGISPSTVRYHVGNIRGKPG